MDVEVVEEGGLNKLFAGVKNAWITLRESNEIPVFPDRKEKKLAYKPFPVSEKALQMGILYDVLLEFDTTEELGDLNARIRPAMAERRLMPSPHAIHLSTSPTQRYLIST